MLKQTLYDGVELHVSRLNVQYYFVLSSPSQLVNSFTPVATQPRN
jgi:hypothetical protein